MGKRFKELDRLIEEYGAACRVACYTFEKKYELSYEDTLEALEAEEAYEVAKQAEKEAKEKLFAFIKEILSESI